MHTLRSLPALLTILVMAVVALGACAPAAAPAPAPTTAPAVAPTTAAAAPAPTAKEAELTVTQNAALGKFLADGDGRTLYMFGKDTKDTSNCNGGCAQVWPPLASLGKPVAKDGVDASLLGTAKRSDGVLQVTYKGMPLYHFSGDQKPGDVKGEGVGQIWWVVTPDGSAFKTAAPASIAIDLGPGRDGDQSGKAVLTAQGDKTQVALDVQPGAAGVAQPAHIHEGACPGVGAVKYPLTNVVDGKSTTTVDAKLSDLLKGGFAITVHQSAQNVNVYVACGALPQGVVINLGPGRDATQPGNVVLVAQGDKTQVLLNVQPGASTVAQPAHIHEGACPGVGPVKYPLTNTVDGKSVTVVNASLADLLKGGFSINVHKSAQELGVYTACAAVTRSLSSLSAPAAAPASNAPANSGYNYP